MLRSIFFLSVVAVIVSCKQHVRPVLAPEYLHYENDMRVITSVINNRDSTISVIYGNDLALDFAKNRQANHLAGEKYVMVTSRQKPMPHWYGTSMNEGVERVEYVTAIVGIAGRVQFDYTVEHYNDKKTKSQDDNVARIEFIANQSAAVFP